MADYVRFYLDMARDLGRDGRRHFFYAMNCRSAHESARHAKQGQRCVNDYPAVSQALWRAIDLEARKLRLQRQGVSDALLEAINMSGDGP